jgi:hypothetical protein
LLNALPICFADCEPWSPEEVDDSGTAAVWVAVGLAPAVGVVPTVGVGVGGTFVGVGVMPTVGVGVGGACVGVGVTPMVGVGVGTGV